MENSIKLGKLGCVPIIFLIIYSIHQGFVLLRPLFFLFLFRGTRPLLCVESVDNSCFSIFDPLISNVFNLVLSLLFAFSVRFTSIPVFGFLFWSTFLYASSVISRFFFQYEKNRKMLKKYSYIKSQDLGE